MISLKEAGHEGSRGAEAWELAEAPSSVDRCVIKVSGGNVEIPAFFKSWIYEEAAGITGKRRSTPPAKGGKRNDPRSATSGFSRPARKRKRKDLAWTHVALEPVLLDPRPAARGPASRCSRSVYEQTKKLKALGETGERLRRLNDWRQEMVFSHREEAALPAGRGAQPRSDRRGPERTWFNSAVSFSARPR